MIRRVSSKGMSQDESAKNHIKDNNWRGIEIFPNADGVPNLYISKGGGGNGDNGIFQVLNGNFPNATLAQVVNGTGAGVPTAVPTTPSSNYWETRPPTQTPTVPRR